jgi:hypothetical protein
MGNRSSTIVIINRLTSEQLSKRQLTEIVRAINTVLPILCEVWDLPICKAVIRNSLPIGVFGYILIGENTDELLGSHSIDVHGQPFAFVNYVTHIRDSAKRGSPILLGRTISHELFEMVVNPHLTGGITSFGSKKIYREVCDPVRSMQINVGGVILSNFVYPSWFSPEGKHPFDYAESIQAPFALYSESDYVTYALEK